LNKTIYVTGITGFIGKNLLPNLLSSYDQVLNFTRQGTIQIINSDDIEEAKITKEFFRNNPSNLLINLATLYQQFPSNQDELNTLINSNILFPSRVVHELSTYNKDLKIINILSYSQLLELSNQNVYSLSKELFKKYLDHSFESIVNVYIFDTFGSGDTRNKVTDVFIKNILSGQPIIVPTNEVRINLSDCNQVNESLINSIDLKPGNYAIQSPDTISLESLAMMIMELMNKEVEIIKKDKAIDYIGTIKLFPENIFPQNPEYSLRNALTKRIQEIKLANNSY
jgi:nucleoside-diphosphate-sugar epimerase